MESNYENLLSHEEICEIADREEELNPIDQFIYENEPAEPASSEIFRTQLFDLIMYVKEE